MIIKDYLNEKLEETFEKLGYDKSDVAIGLANNPQVADYQCNSAFALAKKLNKRPDEIAQTIASELKNYEDDFVATFSKPAFINIKLTDKLLSKIANEMQKDPKNLIKKPQKQLKVVMDYGGANVAKELHIGHVRSPIIGEALCRLNKLMGNEVVTDTHLGDWGLQMGLTIAQLEEDGYLEGYFGRGKNKEITLDTLNEEYPKASKRKSSESEFKKKADDYTLFIQRKKEPFYQIYQDIRALSVAKIREHYLNLGCHFDLWYGESTAGPYLNKAVQIFKDKGLAYMSDGALVVDVAQEGENIPIERKSPDEPQRYRNPMPPVIIKKYNDADLYATTDIATVLMRNEMYHPDKIMYIVDQRQKLHFTQFIRACKLVGISPKEQELVQISFGTVNGKDGKAFKTREGTTVKLDDIINMITNKASERLKENGIVGDEKLSLMIGVGALKFGDLSNVVYKDYVFDLDKFSSFEGKTGPYIQYTAARINSLINKSGVKPGTISIQTEEERNIVINLIKFFESFNTCYEDNSMHTLCTSIYNLASAYALFYNNIKVISEKDQIRKASLVGLSNATLQAIRLGLDTLGIETPEKM